MFMNGCGYSVLRTQKFAVPQGPIDKKNLLFVC